MKKFYTCAFAAVMVLFSCKGDYDAPCRSQAVKQSFGFSTAEKARFPFQKGDTIGFVSNTFDSLTFRVDSVIKVQDSKSSSVAGNPECGPDVDYYEGKIAQLSNDKLNYQVTFRKSNDSCVIMIGSSLISFPISYIGDSTFNYRDSVVFPKRTFYGVNTIQTGFGDSVMVNAPYGVVFFTDAGRSYYLYKYNSK